MLFSSVASSACSRTSDTCCRSRRELGVDQLAAPLGVAMRVLARVDDLELLLEAAAQFLVGIAGRQAIAATPFLLVERLALAIGHRDDFGERGARGQQLQVQPGHLADVADLRGVCLGTLQQADDFRGLAFDLVLLRLRRGIEAAPAVLRNATCCR